MSEVEKMYKIADINMCTLDFRTQYTKCDYKTCNGINGGVTCGWYVVPDFTTEKQIELVKWLIREKYLIGRYIESYYELFTNSMISYNSKNECFEKSLAGLINNLWQDLTEEEKEQIRSILKG